MENKNTIIVVGVIILLVLIYLYLNKSNATQKIEEIIIGSSTGSPSSSTPTTSTTSTVSTSATTNTSVNTSVSTSTPPSNTVVVSNPNGSILHYQNMQSSGAITYSPSNLKLITGDTLTIIPCTNQFTCSNGKWKDMSTSADKWFYQTNYLVNGKNGFFRTEDFS